MLGLGDLGTIISLSPYLPTPLISYLPIYHGKFPSPVALPTYLSNVQQHNSPDDCDFRCSQ
ncbi:hypothetical protein H1P_1800008 [Hyella patelloides LEGE 07179]|uniref:Uncharacterized protein n=1 Tax=Hyella patelloides LEGE 07179 TaxID=945734 RepID=A0A563VNV7_9CYAN|nr:hypothetical protein H1P_1800008 [Hyella patelloides LEGE 07179]